MRLLSWLLSSSISEGRLSVAGPDGQALAFGSGRGPEVAVRVEPPGLGLDTLIDPELKLAEALIEGRLRLEKGDLADLVTLYFLNRDRMHASPAQRLANRIATASRALSPAISRRGARKNAAFHYDLGNDFYRLWLDADMQYSCAYFERGDETLDEAQTAKKRHIAAKLALAPGQHVLDIGCGWGGLALYLAMAADVRVTGITLSERQAEVARARAERLGLADRVRFELRDYREVEGRFDRVVSVGMLEHVGARALPEFFRCLRGLLAEDGVALIHAIGNQGVPGPVPAFLTRYVFPGGHTPALSETFAAIERADLWTLDCEVLRLHYAETLSAWRRRFLAVRGRAVEAYGERFARLRELYLAGCEASFRHGVSMVFQIQLGRRRDAVPLTRDYLAEAKARLAGAERAAIPRLHASTEAVLGPGPEAAAVPHRA